MRLRIETTGEGIDSVVRIDGDLRGPTASAEVRRICRAFHGPLKIDLVNLLSFDPEGIETLRSLAQGGAELIRVSPYVDMILGREEVESETS
jgi:hypothetical protein